MSPVQITSQPLRWRHLKINRLQPFVFSSYFRFARLPFCIHHIWFPEQQYVGLQQHWPWTCVLFFDLFVVSGTISVSRPLPAAFQPYSARDLISSAGLITQQMGTECSVTKTKTNPQLDYGSACVCVCVCVHVSSQTLIWFLNRFPSVVIPGRLSFLSLGLSTLGPCDPCIQPVLISHLNTLLIVLTWSWAACGGRMCERLCEAS